MSLTYRCDEKIFKAIKAAHYYVNNVGNPIPLAIWKAARNYNVCPTAVATAMGKYANVSKKRKKIWDAYSRAEQGLDEYGQGNIGE